VRKFSLDFRLATTSIQAKEVWYRDITKWCL